MNVNSMNVMNVNYCITTVILHEKLYYNYSIFALVYDYNTN